MARPKKYKGDMVLKTVYLPSDLLKWLKGLAERSSVSLNQVIVTLLLSANEDLAKQMIEYYADIQRRIEKELAPANVFHKITNNPIPEEIRKSPEYQNAIKRARQVMARGTPMRNVLEWLPKEIEEIALKHGYMITNTKLLKAALVGELSPSP